MPTVPRTWADLISQYGTPRDVPDDLFYAYINQAPFRGELANKMTLAFASAKAQVEKKDDATDSQIENQTRYLAHDKYHELMSKSDIWLEGRRRAQQDLFFLARYFTWESNPESQGRTFDDNRICEEVHRRVCDLFVKKDNSRSIKEQDTVCKRRILLYPRLSMKSTIDVLDAVQWVLNFPEIRILFLTAADDLAVGFLDEAKGHFIEKLDEPSLMNLFFPEMCQSEKEMAKETAFEFTCPAWKRKGIRRKEATIMASSITSTLSGLHFEVVKADDPVSNRNSENTDQCNKVTKQINTSVRKMARQWGYIDGIGTRYADEDYWGDVLSKNLGDLEKSSDTNWELTVNQRTGQKILIGRAIVIKPEVAAQLEKDGKPVTYTEAGEAGCDLLFPDVITYSFLMQEYTTDEISFEGQYNNNPRPESATFFTRPLLLKSTVHFEEMPHVAPMSQTWDFAFSQKKGRDYSTGSCAMWDEKGVCYINDLIRDRFSPMNLAQAVVDFAKRWHPFVIGIEDAAGSRAYEYAIQMQAQKTQDPQVIAVCNAIDWVTPTNQKDAKRTRMGALHPWLMNGQLRFAGHLPHLEALYSEFERCQTSHHHDDIPDVISRQTKYAPRMLAIIQKNEIETWSKASASWNLLFEDNCDEFGRIGMGGPIFTIEPDPEPEEIQAEGPPGMGSILGAGLWG